MVALNSEELLNKKSLRDFVNIEDASTAVKIINDQIMKLIDELNEINIIREKIKNQIKDLNRVALYLKNDYESVDLFHNQRWKLLEAVFGQINEGTQAPSDAATKQMLKEKISEVLSTLKISEKTVLELRFGLTDGKSRTLEEVGKEFGVEGERIRQIEAKALRKLRVPIRSRKLREVIENITEY